MFYDDAGTYRVEGGSEGRRVGRKEAAALRASGAGLRQTEMFKSVPAADGEYRQEPRAKRTCEGFKPKPG